MGGVQQEMTDVEKAVFDLLRALGVPDTEDVVGVGGTPARVARMYRDELLASYRPNALEELQSRLTFFPVSHGQREMVVVRDVPFVSLCAHHMLPFSGTVDVGYIPEDWLVGLSKIPRVVDFFAAKLQMQERLTSEVADFLQAALRPRAILVRTRARHMCMELRGVKKAGSRTSTTALRGAAMDNSVVRSEFYEHLKLLSDIPSRCVRLCF